MNFLLPRLTESYQVTAEMLASLEPEEMVARVADLGTFPEGGSFPITAPGTEGRRFRENFGELLRQLVSRSRLSILYDGRLMDQLLGLATTMSGVQVRVVRHTGTLAALHLVAALASVSQLEGEQEQTTVRQLEAETRKRPERRAADRLEVLQAKLEELAQNQQELTNMIEHLYKSVFVLRCKDSATEIRALCLEHLGQWLKVFPERFLDDSYLKYLGWFLHDPESQVRRPCVQALLPLYEAPQLRSKLELFTVKFKPRMVALTLDLDLELAVEAMQLLVLLVRQEPDVLQEECEQMFLSVYSKHRSLGQAAGVFLVEQLRARGHYPGQTVTSRRKARRPDSFLLRDLVTFSQEVELAQHEDVLVESIMASCPVIRDWQALVDLLLEEPGQGEEALALTQEEESTVMALLAASLKQAVEGQAPEWRGGQKKVLTTREQGLRREAKVEATYCLLPVLPKLLYKFLPFPEVAAQVLELLQWLELE